MTSTSAPDLARRAPRRAARSLLVLAFWLGVWQVAALAVGHEILLASPTAVLGRLAELIPTADFWATVGHTVLRIGAGFLIAAVVGVIGASLAATSRVVDALTAPLVTAVRSVPVVSFIILALIWAGSDVLAVIVSALMVMPIVHTNVLQGIRRRDQSLLDVAAVFQMPLLARLRAVDLPAVGPYFVAACQIGIGLAWKSGVAAEVIGMAEGSIGEQLYQAKIFLSTADLFAWTLTIVALSFTVERAVVAGLRRFVPAVPTGQEHGGSR